MEQSPKTKTDLIEARGLSERIAQEYRAKAETLRNRFNAEWWDTALKRFRTGMMPDRSWSVEYVGPCNVYPLKFGIPEDGAKTEASLDVMEHSRPPFDSTYSYYPEVLYRYGRNDAAYRYLLEISDPAFSGYRMAETAFAAIGAIGVGLMGIAPDATQATIETMPRLPKDMQWIRMSDVPVAGGRIGIEHRGNAETRFTNQAGATVVWKAAFPVPERRKAPASSSMVRQRQSSREFDSSPASTGDSSKHRLEVIEWSESVNRS